MFAFVFFPVDPGWGGTNAVCAISNAGVFAGAFSTLILNVSPAEILGLHKDKLVVINGKFVSRPTTIMFVISVIQLTQMATI